jgi:hypothetical protein
MWALAACSPAPPPPPVAVPPPAAPADTASVPRADARPARGAATIACGKSACDAATQVCCDLDELAACAERILPVHGEDAGKRYAAQIAACGEEAHSVRLCDDSSDCEPGSVCCSDSIGGGASLVYCKPLPEDGASPCQWREVCNAGAPCGLPDSICRDGSCVREAALIGCGHAGKCQANEAVCCQRQSAAPACTTESECLGTGRMIGCAGPRSCLRGERCCESAMGAYCAGECINARVVCDTAKDCEPALFGHKLKGCQADADSAAPWVKACQY